MSSATGRQRRLALDEEARLAPNEWSNVEVRLLECSERGFRAECDISIPVGASVRLDVPGLGPVLAYVSWRRTGEFAATFGEPIDLSRARFMALNQEAVLARLLTERARAHAAGRNEEERSLRGRILTGLPIKTVEGGAN
ncbi:MAG TPA: hypothetical protein VGW40_13560 [Allosphingosinicella sp.]|nr:hypothetical protein [Allosphingosinicella sp.]